MEITNQKCLQCQSSLTSLNLANEKIRELEGKIWEIEKKKALEYDVQKERYELVIKQEREAKSAIKKEMEDLGEKLTQFTNFWEKLPQKTKPEIMDLLIHQLGTPKSEQEINCLDAVAKKFIYFFNESKDGRSQSVSSLIGTVVEMTQKEFKEGKRKGKVFYQMKLENKTILRASKEDLPVEKWTQVEQLSVLDQKLLFKYRKWIVHKDIIDFEPVNSEPITQPQPSQP